MPLLRLNLSIKILILLNNLLLFFLTSFDRLVFLLLLIIELELKLLKLFLLIMLVLFLLQLLLFHIILL